MQKAAGPPPRKHFAPETQSLSAAHGNAQRPACRLHLWPRHCTSLWQLSAVGPGGARSPAWAAGTRAVETKVAAGCAVIGGIGGIGGDGSLLHAVRRTMPIEAAPAKLPNRMASTVRSYAREAKRFC